MKTAKEALMVGVNEPFVIKEYPILPPPDGYALMKLTASGVCGTDLHIHRGKIPTSLPASVGHEFVGVVEQISETDSKKYGILAGDSVIVDIACPCGECLLCKTGDEANCVDMGVTNGGDPDTPPYFRGGYGEYNCSPIKNLIKIPEALDPKMTCVFACAGPTAIHAFSLAERADRKIASADTAVVQGSGPVGSFAIMYLASLGIKNIIAVTFVRTQKTVELCRKLGAMQVIDLAVASEEDMIKRVQAHNGGLGADVVFEASGNPKAVPQGMAMLRNRGTYLIPGQYSNSGDVAIQPQLITFKALCMIGSSQYSMDDVASYLEFLEANPQLHSCISSLASCYPVADINHAIADAGAGKNIKTMLV